LEKNSKLFYLFQTYIAHVPAHGDFLFNNQELQCVDETSFSRKIGNIFDSATLKVFGKKIRVTANILRHSFITNMYENNLYRTVALRTQKSLEMGHSLKDQFLYVKYV
jgi:site-specific recombinase XerD